MSPPDFSGSRSAQTWKQIQPSPEPEAADDFAGPFALAWSLFALLLASAALLHFAFGPIS